MVVCVSASAQEISKPSMFSVSGFGTLGLAQSDTSSADFVSSVFRPNGAGASKSVSADVDTKLGLQVTARFNDDLTGIVQLIAQQRYDNSYTPGVEWANISYKLTPDLRVRVGRVVWPLFTQSENVNVGYSTASVRSSAELAAEMPNTYSDGLDASYSFAVGTAKNTLTAVAGNSRVNYPGSDYLDVKNIRGLSDVLEYGDLTVHAAYFEMAYIFSFGGNVSDSVQLPMLTAGALYDNGSWFVSGDVLQAKDPYYGRMDAFAFMGGMHIGSVSPYAGYSQFTQSTYGPGSATLQNPTQGTTTAGLRWDFRKNLDLKFQYDHVDSGDVATVFPISMVFPNGTQEFLKKPRTNIFSVVMDFVF
jgi:hypothetical protein